MTRLIRKWQRARITKYLVSLKILVLGPMLIRPFLLVLINTTCYENMWPFFRDSVYSKRQFYIWSLPWSRNILLAILRSLVMKTFHHLSKMVELSEQDSALRMRGLSVAILVLLYLCHKKSHSFLPPVLIAVQYTMSLSSFMILQSNSSICTMEVFRYAEKSVTTSMDRDFLLFSLPVHNYRLSCISITLWHNNPWGALTALLWGFLYLIQFSYIYFLLEIIPSPREPTR